MTGVSDRPRSRAPALNTSHIARLSEKTPVVRTRGANAEMLVLVAIDRGAILYTSGNGVTRLLRSIDFKTYANDDGLADGENSLAYRLFMLLEREAVADIRRYDIVAIFADEHLYEDFNRLRALSRRTVLVSRLDYPEKVPTPA